MTGKCGNFQKLWRINFSTHRFWNICDGNCFHHRYFKNYEWKNWFFIVFEKSYSFLSHFLELSENKNTFIFHIFLYLEFLYYHFWQTRMWKKNIFFWRCVWIFRCFSRIIFSASSALFGHSNLQASSTFVAGIFILVQNGGKFKIVCMFGGSVISSLVAWNEIMYIF